MEFNWSSAPNSSVNYDDFGSISNSQPDISGVQENVAHDGNEMDSGLVPYTQPQSGHASQTLYSTSHYAGPELDMPPMEVYPDICPTPEQSIPGGSDYGWFPNSSFPGVNYIEGLESTRNTGMMYGEYQETVFNTINLDNNNNTHHSTVLSPSSFFNSNAHAVHGMHSTIPVGTPIYGHADVHAQAPNFGLDLNLNLDPALTLPTSTMPNSIPLLTPSLLPSTPTAPIITTTTPTTVASYDYDYDHNYDHNYDRGKDRHTSAACGSPPEEKSSKNERRKYRVSYDHHASHRYTCHACRFSTDVKRDFARHLNTGKHEKRKAQEDEINGWDLLMGKERERQISTQEGVQQGLPEQEMLQGEILRGQMST